MKSEKKIPKYSTSGMEFTPAAVSQYNRVQNEMEYGKNRISCRRKLANGRRYSLS